MLTPGEKTFSFRVHANVTYQPRIHSSDLIFAIYERITLLKTYSDWQFDFFLSGDAYFLDVV